MAGETKEIRVKVVGSGTDKDPLRVPLPNYVMVPGSEVYQDGKLKSVKVRVPADECDNDGKLDEAKIRQKYKNLAAWDKKGVVANAVAEEP